MIWGFAGPWYGEFRMRGEEYLKDEKELFYASLAFIQHYGLSCLGSNFQQLEQMSAVECAELGQYLIDHDLCMSAGIGAKWLTMSIDDAQRFADKVDAQLTRFAGLMRTPIITTGAGAGHRFDRTLPVEEKLALLARALTPVAAVCHAHGLPFGIENHCDYYISDLVQLCQQTPHLGIFLDTGNTYMIGEKPLPAFAEAASYVVGGHFKDHYVAPRPNGSPMNFEVIGAALGEGDVPLRECYALLQQYAPQPERLVLELEMIVPPGMDPRECMNRSMEFVNSLRGMTA